jgi:hypothetical protein
MQLVEGHELGVQVTSQHRPRQFADAKAQEDDRHGARACLSAGEAQRAVKSTTSCLQSGQGTRQTAICEALHNLHVRIHTVAASYGFEMNLVLVADDRGKRLR